MFGIMLIMAASFGFEPSLSPSNVKAPDFQLILAIGGLAGIIIGIIKSG